MNPLSARSLRFSVSCGSGSLLALLLSLLPAAAAVEFLRLPEPGVQPQILVASDGAVHLLYLTGDPKAANIVYRHQAPGASEWSAPLRVNSQEGSAIAIGTIRGAQLALGRGGRVHVCWNGSQTAEPKPAAGGVPLLYARLSDKGDAFTPQRNLMGASSGLDGGGSVAADSEGRVFVFWHGAPVGKTGETNRAVFLASSTDEGSTFSSERIVSTPGSGACGCCGLSASINQQGQPTVIFRSARSLGERDMTLLSSSDHGAHFAEVLTDPWPIAACPMSSASFNGVGQVQWAAWETAGRIQVARSVAGAWPSAPRSFGPAKGAKHPRLAMNHRGETLLVWTEGTGWQRGGSLAWQVLDVQGQPSAEKGKREGVGVWSFGAAYARPNGDFVVLY